MTAETEHLHTDWLKYWAQTTPHAIAIKDAVTGREYSYLECFQISQCLAGELQNRYQLERGDRVAVLATNEVEYFFLFFALQKLAAIMVPINFRLTAREIAHIISDSEPQLLVLQRSFETHLQNIEIAAAVNNFLFFDGPESLKEIVQNSVDNCTGFESKSQFDDPCMILYTSGTTGAPKGALITHKMLFWNSISTTLRLNISQSDVCVSFLPFFHTGGWNVLNTPFFHRGAKVIFLPKFDAEQILNVTQNERVTILFGVPTTMEMLRQAPMFQSSDLSSVRYAIVGGEPMPIPAIQAWAEKGIPVRQGFGMTEFGPNIFSLNEEDAVCKIGSIGFPNCYIDVRLVDDQGHDVAPGTVGELWLRGPACTPGYWRNSKATQETIRNGWLASGDLLRQDEDGYYFVVGRKKDMFISGGENVYPTEIEHVLRKHPAVSDVAVIGVKDEKWGEVGRAFVLPQKNSQLTREEVFEYCRRQLAKFKIPAHITFVDDLPKGESGKILKRALREISL